MTEDEIVTPEKEATESAVNMKFKEIFDKLKKQQ